MKCHGYCLTLQFASRQELVRRELGSSAMRVTRRSELLAIAAALERLVLELREVAEAPDVEPAPRQEAPRDSTMVGRRVRITIKGEYKNRLGTIVDKRGTMFWNILLDAADGGVARVIYKMETSFLLIDDN